MAKVENMTDKGGYVIDVQNAKNNIYVNVVGVFTPQQAESFHKDYQKQVNSIESDKYVLEVDCKDMQVINQDMIPKLTQSFEMYKASGFKKIEFLISNNVVIKMQLNRIARTVNLPSYEIISA